MNGPVSVTAGVSTAITQAQAARPNPFRRSTELEFTVGSDIATGGHARVSLVVRDVQGRVVRRLLEGPMAVGIYHVAWDATDRLGRRVSPGAYYLSLDAGAVSRTKKVTVIE
jgi:F420-0:gamma-glutamyl ligase